MTATDACFVVLVMMWPQLLFCLAVVGFGLFALFLLWRSRRKR